MSLFDDVNAARASMEGTIADHFYGPVTHVESGNAFRGKRSIVYMDDDGVRTMEIMFSCLTSEIPASLVIGHKITNGVWTDRIISIDPSEHGKTVMMMERTQ